MREDKHGSYPGDDVIHKTQHGVTLIELLIVMFIMSILVAIVLPIYTGYAMRSKIAEGIGLASVAQRHVEEYHHVNGIFPIDNAQAGMGTAASYRGSFVRDITVIADGVIQVEFDDPTLQGGLLVFTPNEAGAAVRWTCNSPNISPSLLPKECR